MAQMSKQEEIIAKKRQEILEKQKTAELAKQVAAAQTSSVNTTKSGKEKKSMASKAAAALADAAMVKNNFSNDGSFFENFKKITDAAAKKAQEEKQKQEREMVQEESKFDAINSNVNAIQQIFPGNLQKPPGLRAAKPFSGNPPQFHPQNPAGYPMGPQPGHQPVFQSQNIPSLLQLPFQGVPPATFAAGPPPPPPPPPLNPPANFSTPPPAFPPPLVPFPNIAQLQQLPPVLNPVPTRELDMNAPAEVAKVEAKSDYQQPKPVSFHATSIPG